MASMFRVVDCRQNLGYFIYKVVKYKVECKDWHVSHYPSSGQLIFSCLRMQSYGIPCGHQIDVLVSLNIEKLPPSLLLYRWNTVAKDKYKG